MYVIMCIIQLYMQAMLRKPDAPEQVQLHRHGGQWGQAAGSGGIALTTRAIHPVVDVVALTIASRREVYEQV